MKQDLVITFIGSDRPGIVQDMSQRVTAHGGNWLESQMTRLAGKFAGVARVSVSEPAFEALVQDLNAIPGMTFILDAPEKVVEDLRASAFSLNIVGPDRPGILAEITSALAEQGVNLVDLATEVGPAPMTGVLTFFAEVAILVPAETEMETVHAQLNRISDDLGVDIHLDSPEMTVP